MRNNRFECTEADIINGSDLPTGAAIELQNCLLETHEQLRVFCPNDGKGTVQIGAAAIAHGLGVKITDTVANTAAAVIPWVNVDEVGEVTMCGFALYVQRPTEDDTIN